MSHVQSSKQESDGYSDMPLNTRQQSAVQIIKMWYPIQQKHAKCVQTAITVITNVLYKPTQEKYHKLRLNKPKVKKSIVDINGGIKLLKLAGFSQKTENDGNKILCIDAPTTMEEFEQLTDIWLILLKTQYNWGINPDPNAAKTSILPKTFQVPNTIKYKMENFFHTNEIAKSHEFQQYVKKSNDPNVAPNAEQRYNFFAKAIKMLCAADTDNFFDLKAQHGLNDIDASDVCALIVSEILCGYYDEDEAYTSLILAEDLRIMAEQQKEFTATFSDKKQQKMYAKGDKIVLEMKDEELQGTIRWIGESDKWEKGLWFGVELDCENVVYGHNGYFNQERFFGCADSFGIYIRQKQIIKLIQSGSTDSSAASEMKNNENIVDSSAYKVVDIGCGWGNLGRLLMDNNVRGYMGEIEKESLLKKVCLYGFDISQEMIGIGRENKFDKYYVDMVVLDCKRNELKQFGDGTVDVITSVNCIMQDKKIGHPSETFLIEANRLLKVGGWFVVTRRFHGVHLGLQLYAYLMIAQQLGWKNVFASRVREIFYIGWQKMQNPMNEQ